MSYTYEYPHPAVTTDIVIFTILDDALKVLLILRADEPYQGCWALPGGFLEMNESIEACALRELGEETGISDVYLEQLCTFGDVGRDPRERVVSIAYFALISLVDQTLTPGVEATEANWFDVDTLPKLAFDHAVIMDRAIKRLADKMKYSSVGFQLMPNAFTLSELMRVYELAGRKPLDKRNFRKWIHSLALIVKTGEKKADGAHRPAMLYTVKDKSLVENIR